jgi:hypothetical protein
MPRAGILKPYAKLCLIAFLLALPLILGSVPVAAQLILDQNQENDGSGVTLVVGDQRPFSSGQEFTPALTPLAAVEINVDTTYHGPCTLEASILQGTALHDLSGAVLGSPVSKALPGGFSGWVRFDFSTAISVTPGQTYAILIIVTSGVGSGPVWYFADYDAYPNGKSITFGASQPSDMMFRTYSGSLYSISNSGNIEVMAGQSNHNDIQFHVASGESVTDLTLSCTNLPLGAACSVFPPILLGGSYLDGASFQVTVSTSPSTPPGSYLITVVATFTLTPIDLIRPVFSLSSNGGSSLGPNSVTIQQDPSASTQFNLIVDPATAIPEYPLGLPVLVIFMVIAYGLIKRKTRNPEDI